MNDRGKEELELLRNKILGMARDAELDEDPLRWFEELYDFSDGDSSFIPWSDGKPHEFLIDWASDKPPNGKALVVGSGLGEDAVFLSDLGWDVTAFDISETAIKWSSKIHQKSDVEWRVENLLNLPEEWEAYWDLVVEIHILQAVPQGIRESAAPNLATLLSKGGRLVCIGRFDSSGKETEGPPWPLDRQFIDSIGRGLKQISFEVKRRAFDEVDVQRYISVWEKK